MPDLGRRLRELRLKRKLSLYDVEKLTGLHFTTIGKYERNERRPSLDVLRELAGVYQVSLGELVSEAQDVAEYLPEELRDSVRLLSDRADLSRLVAAAGRLRRDQVDLLVSFLTSLTPAAVGPAPGAGEEGERQASQPSQPTQP